MQHLQSDFVIPALLVIDSYKDGCNSTTIKDEVHLYIELTLDDLAPYESRRKSEPRYRQTVGNLISHRAPALFMYLDEVVRQREGKKSTECVWKLNKEGKAYIANVKKVREAGKNLIENFQKSYDNTRLTDIETKIISYVDQKKIDNAGKKGRVTDTSLKDTILKLSEYQCFFGKCIGEEHISFMTNDGHQFMEVHHFIPMKASDDFFPRNLDRASNLVCLCPTCHERVHHGSMCEKETVLKVLYDEIIDGLNDEEIYISYSQLLNYYK